MTTSLTDLLAAMPASCAAIFAERLLGHSAGLPELSAALADRERLKRELAGLDDAERGLLRDLGDLDGYCEWDVAARIYAERLDWLRASLASLGRRGLVFQAGLSQHGALVLLPGVDALLDDAAAPAGLDWPAREVDELVEAVLVLNALRTLNLRCRTEGEPFKKGWQQLDDLLGPEIDGHGLFAELSELNCIGEESGLLRVLPGSASDLAIGGPLRYRIWRLQRSCRAFPGLAQRLLRLLEQGPQRRERLQRGLELHLFQHCRGAAAGEAGRLLELWLAAGLVQADESGDWLRLEPLTAAALFEGDFGQPAYGDQVIVKPDLEILVPRELDPLEHVHLGEVADLVRPDVMSLYRLSRASVQRAVQAGWTCETILGFLERVAHHQLPANVAQSVRGWAGAPGLARILTGTFLFVDGERGELPGLEFIRPGVYRLSAEPGRELRQSLERLGIRLEAQAAAVGSIDWGPALNVRRSGRGARHKASQEGVYPYGLAQPLPVGQRGVEIFESARRERRSLLILYPRRGYGEVQLRRIRPVGVYAAAGAHFVEAFCEDAGQAEVFELARIRALISA